MLPMLLLKIFVKLSLGFEFGVEFFPILEHRLARKGMAISPSGASGENTCIMFKALSCQSSG